MAKAYAASYEPMLTDEQWAKLARIVEVSEEVWG